MNVLHHGEGVLLEPPGHVQRGHPVLSAEFELGELDDDLVQMLHSLMREVGGGLLVSKVT